VADKAPDFSAQASLAGKEFSFSLPDALKKGPVVVYFYPSAYTRGCDLESHTFAQEKENSMQPALPSLGYRLTASRDSMRSRQTRTIAPESFRSRPTPMERLVMILLSV
jgi:peroxiredoxin